jgi:leader peptidase (prepilin peptidase)/N-methyltransferase
MFHFTLINSEMPWFFPVAVTLFGACIGSFLNVVIYRVPAGKSVVTPGSHCACGAPIAWYDNIPVLSRFLLRGRARCCGRSYSFRYAFVELLTALLFLVCWLQFSPTKALAGVVFISLLIGATFIDLDHLIIPDSFTIGGGLVGLVLSLVLPALHGHDGGIFVIDSLRAAVAGAQGLLVGSGLVLWIALTAEAVLKKEAMGFGDVKFVGMIGAFCGWQGAVFAVFGGAVVGTVWFTVALGWQKLAGKPTAVAPRAETPEGEPAELGLGVHVPFGPMLAIAAAIYFLSAAPHVAAYFSSLAELLQPAP